MSCSEYLDRLMHALEEGAPAGELGAHEATCGSCRARGASMRGALDGIAALPSKTPPGLAKGAWQKVASAHAPWEPAAPGLFERIGAWFAPGFALPAIAGAAAIAIAVAGFAPQGGGKPTEKLAVVEKSAGVTVNEAKGAILIEVPEAGHARLALGLATSGSLAGPAAATMRGPELFVLTRGAVSFNVRHDLVGPKGFTVETPHGNVKVTGTNFSVRATSDDTTVELYEGSVELEANGKSETMKPGERLVSNAGGMLFLRRAAGQPAWPLPPTAPASAVARPEIAPVPAAAARESAPVRPEQSVVKPDPGQTGDRLGGAALPPVSGNANVHDPFPSR